MTSALTCIGDDELRLLRRMLGQRVTWIYGTPFLTEGELTVATRLAIFVGRSSSSGTTDEYLSFGSDRFETPKDVLDYARFRVRIADSLGDALGTTGALFVDTSAIVDLGQEEVQSIRIFAARIDGDGEEIQYDAIIRFEFDSNRAFAFGHAPGVYEGVCVTRGESVTLGNPKNLWERVALVR